MNLLAISQKIASDLQRKLETAQTEQKRLFQVRRENTQEILEVSKEIEQLMKKIQAEEAIQEVLQKMGTLSE